MRTKSYRAFFASTALILSFLSAPHASAFCFEEAGDLYGLPPDLLIAISKTESGLRADLPPSWNTDGSYDVGLMQVNSNWYFWSPVVRNLWPNIQDPCTNVMTGAWILAQCVRKYGYNWKGIGCYHSQTPDKRDEYARRVAKKLFNTSKTTTENLPSAPENRDSSHLAQLFPKGYDNATAIP